MGAAATIVEAPRRTRVTAEKESFMLNDLGVECEFLGMGRCDFWC